MRPGQLIAAFLFWPSVSENSYGHPPCEGGDFEPLFTRDSGLTLHPGKACAADRQGEWENRPGCPPAPAFAPHAKPMALLNDQRHCLLTWTDETDCGRLMTATRYMGDHQICLYTSPLPVAPP
eukprot:NODE_22352_length_712_cov_1.835897.p1 GENE.NODE_22352_length_712_cov_1.835897~~NODE_22352_length_712_cov_1.835897.p1  ORF type:complete len:123 (-),score=17.61 NODE_22352_length_712_cov_1.835897:221-589(-)